jgi:glycine cleavage system H protein
MQHPADRKYTKEHEWAKIEGALAVIGITWHAQDALGDVVYVEMPAVGAEFKQFEEFGVVESVKTVSTLYCPVSGKVIETNAELAKRPEIINSDPHGQGWILKIKMSSPAEEKNLLSAAEYEALLKA